MPEDRERYAEVDPRRHTIKVRAWMLGRLWVCRTRSFARLLQRDNDR
jgi:hypothetical protein